MRPTGRPWAGDFLFPHLLSYECNGVTTVPQAWDERLCVLGPDGQTLNSLCELRFSPVREAHHDSHFPEAGPKTQRGP